MMSSTAPVVTAAISGAGSGIVGAINTSTWEKIARKNS